MAEQECFHCGLPIRANERFSLMVDGVSRQFCCPACRAVAEIIVAGGFGAYYQRHQTTGVAARTVAAGSYAAFDGERFQRQHVMEVAQSSERGRRCHVRLLIRDIHCTACIWLLERYLIRIDGVERVRASLTEQLLELDWNPERVKLSQLCDALAALGYRPEPFSAAALQSVQREEKYYLLRRLGVAGVCMMQIGMLSIALYAGAFDSMEEAYRSLLSWVAGLLSLPVMLYGAQPFFRNAWNSIPRRQLSMDVPVALALLLAFVASWRALLSGVGEIYFDSISMLTFLLLCGRFLEMQARHFNARGSQDVLSVLPLTAWCPDERGRLECRPVEDISPGQQVVVKAGEVVPVDGRLLSGAGTVNEASLSGEFGAVSKQPGDVVLAGSVNGALALQLEVTATGGALQLNRINTLLMEARQHKPRVIQQVDRLAGVFVTVVLILAASCYLLWLAHDENRAFWVALSVLVVSCPCALSLATPAVLTAATNRLRRAGLLVTRAHVWEGLAGLGDVIFDKTGTLTQGALQVSSIELLDDRLDRSNCYRIAALLEQQSEHPLSRAFVLRDDDDLPGVRNFQQQRGGLAGEIDGQLYRLGNEAFAAELYAGQVAATLAQDEAHATPGTAMVYQQVLQLATPQGPCCRFILQDEVRNSAAACVADLQARGLKVHVLSGDSSAAVQQLASSLGAGQAVSGASPEQKLAYLRSLQHDGRKVLMIGDGINDVPVLAAADVSIAMSTASELAKTQADAILLGDDLQKIGVLLDTAQKARRGIWQNLAWALAYNLLAIPLAGAGYLAPWMAVIGMSLSSLVVVLNALRLQRSLPALASPGQQATMVDAPAELAWQGGGPRG